jgi:hypothetical protein
MGKERGTETAEKRVNNFMEGLASPWHRTLNSNYVKINSQLNL